MKRLLDQHGDIKEVFHYDHTEGKAIIQTVQDISTYLRTNRVERNTAREGWKGDVHKVASVPKVIVQQWNKELGDYCLKPEYRQWLIAKLNDYNNSNFRTKAGRI